ncbi:MAG: stage II sporulation protein M [Gloeomargaritaceae cyanobacterium C42_A2020_066]|nr:stage II sporulation protein M [Gloeomargaritaceae cyanobacterium C42_A2020_066]
MRAGRWVARREADWQRFQALMQRIERQGLRHLTGVEIRQWANLYRAVTADLARARSYDVGPALRQDLQSLARRGFVQMYQGGRPAGGVVRFYRRQLPEVLWQTLPYTSTAAAMLGIGGLLGWGWGHDPQFLVTLLPKSLIAQVQERGELWMGSILGNEPWASSNIMVNNLTVALRAAAGGVTAGLFTTYVLFFNGLILGGIARLVADANLAYPFWAFVLPHGSLELPAIILAGGAGLLLGRALLIPGRFQRGAALRVYGSLAAQLLYAVIPLLVVAGVIEGFVSPQPAVPGAFKYGLGTALLGGLIAYVIRGRPGQVSRDTERLAGRPGSP